MLIKIREEVFRKKIIAKIDSLEYVGIDQISEDIKILKSFSADYFDIQSEAKITFGDDYATDFDDTFGDTFEQTFEKIKESVERGREKLEILSQEREKFLLDEKEKNEKKAVEEVLVKQKFKAGNLLEEIKLRCEAMIAKCDLDSLEKVSDFQIMDIKKQFWDSDPKMYEIFGKVTEYSNIAALCGEDKDKMLVGSRALQNKALDARNAFCQKLYQEIEERGVDEDKLKRGGDVTIELSKFKGYDSKLDIYSFRAEFERLIQPTILKRYWVDTLKTKYLTGPALTLVDKTESIAEIWTKLINAYGNVKLLLQNKISTLDKFESLSKVKGDEKLGNSIAKIVNVMTELSNLAKKFNLEQKLYIGGGLEKITSLLGNERERKFMKGNLELMARRKASSASESKSLDSEGPSEFKGADFAVGSATSCDPTSELLGEKQRWTDLKNFLYKELTFCEQMTLVEKSKAGLGIVPSEKNNRNETRHVHNVTGGGVKCTLSPPPTSYLAPVRRGSSAKRCRTRPYIGEKCRTMTNKLNF